jgi:hypothetical protein
MRKLLMIVAATVLLHCCLATAEYPPSGGWIGVYFDPEGTNHAISGFPPGSWHDIWVVIHWEASVGGASYRIEGIPSAVLVIEEEFFDAVAIGSAVDGCGVEVGLIHPAFGFNNTPVTISRMRLFNASGGGAYVYINIYHHCNYDDLVVADSLSNLYTIGGNNAVIDMKTTTWGAVKDMYR